MYLKTQLAHSLEASDTGREGVSNENHDFDACADWHETVQDVIEFGQQAGAFYNSITNYDFGNTHVHVTTSSVTVTIHFRVGPIRLIIRDPKTKAVLSHQDLPALDVPFNSLEAALTDPRVPLKAKETIRSVYIPRLDSFRAKFAVAAAEVRAIQKGKGLSDTASLDLLKSKLKDPLAVLISGVPDVRVD